MWFTATELYQSVPKSLVGHIVDCQHTATQASVAMDEVNSNMSLNLDI